MRVILTLLGHSPEVRNKSVHGFVAGSGFNLSQLTKECGNRESVENGIPVRVNKTQALR